MNNMQSEVLAKMMKNFRTSSDYCDGYMSTIEGFSPESKNVANIDVNLDVVKAIKATEVLAKSDKVASETHMAGNPIYNREFIKNKLKEQNKEISHIEHRHKIKDIIEEIYEDDEEVNVL